ncbi:DNA polymerase IV [Actinoplanes aureus]|uniref:DNA polymerase IV n=1 Tax=Actinoplanes aureus TaxID=2792083 RepID=A0A931CA79_9ACTN|nr:DNA polymerase IV [Actinoplanes aureus]MBG0563706.1 DNA polymerase IV [Actinoplanes aureus]
MRAEPSILHVDLDAMFAAVEQRDKVSLRGKPVIVGGVAGRGVVATASYEARAFGARSAMPMAQARRRCPPGTAYLSPRFAAYKRTSEVVMALLAEVTPLVEQVSIDEAYLDLAAAGHDLSPRGVTEIAMRLKREIAAATGGITGSVGVASSKLLAKIGSELRKPDGLTVVPAGGELAVLHPLPVGRLGGVGPATEQRLHRSGVRTVGQLAEVPLEDLVDWFGTAHGGGLFRLARADDDRPVVGEREAKSVSAEETFEVDLTDPVRLNRELDLLSARVAGRLRSGGITGRTVNIKVRHHDFTTVTRAITRDQPTDDPRLVAQLARRLLTEIDTSGGIRLLGVGVSTLADFAQDDLFSSFPEGFWSAVPAGPAEDEELDHPFMREEVSIAASDGEPGGPPHPATNPGGLLAPPATALAGRPTPPAGDSGAQLVPAAPDLAGRPASGAVDSDAEHVPAAPDLAGPPVPEALDPGERLVPAVGQVEAFPAWRPGQDVRHEEYGAGWVWGSGLGRVTVRFEGPRTPPGPVRTFAADDPLLSPADPPDWRE